MQPAQLHQGIWEAGTILPNSYQPSGASCSLPNIFCLLSLLQVICACGSVFCLALSTCLPREQPQQTGLCPAHPMPWSWGEGPSLLREHTATNGQRQQLQFSPAASFLQRFKLHHKPQRFLCCPESNGSQRAAGSYFGCHQCIQTKSFRAQIACGIIRKAKISGHWGFTWAVCCLKDNSPG